MSANFHPAIAVAQMIGVVDHPAGKPQYLAFQITQQRQPLI